MSELFKIPKDRESLWTGMPEFLSENKSPYQTVSVHFRNADDVESFSRFVGRKLTPQTNSFWYPEQARHCYKHLCYSTDKPVFPRYPVYIVSKGRWESRLTSKALEQMSIPYRIVIEPQEFDDYASVISPKKILTLPFSNLGKGSIPARNWIWEHSLKLGAKRHWILDDNIRAFYRWHNNLRIPTLSGAIFRAAEDFTERYINVGLSGLNYKYFAATSSSAIPPFYRNTRIYSCILIRNDLPFRWRGRYNEDTDLSLRVLKSGLCTILFNAFLADKISTMVMKGGNTDELYAGDGRLKMAQSLQKQHPDLVTVARKWGRAQHHVDYRPFRRNLLILDPKRKDIEEEVNNYGMKLMKR